MYYVLYCTVNIYPLLSISTYIIYMYVLCIIHYTVDICPLLSISTSIYPLYMAACYKSYPPHSSCTVMHAVHAGSMMKISTTPLPPYIRLLNPRGYSCLCVLPPQNISLSALNIRLCSPSLSLKTLYSLYCSVLYTVIGRLCARPLGKYIHSTVYGVPLQCASHPNNTVHPLIYIITSAK